MGNFVYARSSECGIVNSLEVEVCDFKRGLKYCVIRILLPVIMETHSLILNKIPDEIWEVLWRNAIVITEIKGLMIQLKI